MVTDSKQKVTAWAQKQVIYSCEPRSIYITKHFVLMSAQFVRIFFSIFLNGGKKQLHVFHSMFHHQNNSLWEDCASNSERRNYYVDN